MLVKAQLLVAEKKILSKYNSEKLQFDWTTEFENKIGKIVRVDNFVFVTTVSWKAFHLSLLDFHSGKLLWTVKAAPYSHVIIHENVLYFLDSSMKVNALSMETGTELFRVKSTFRWSAPQLALINNKLYLYSKKQQAVVDLKYGTVSHAKAPQGIDFSKVFTIIDEQQINLSATKSGSDDGFAAVGMVGSDHSGGDFGGGGDAG